MKHTIALLAASLLCASLLIPGTKAAEAAGKEIQQNVRVILEMAETNKPAATFVIVGSEGRLHLDNIVEMIKIDDNLVPAILSFQATRIPLGDSVYTVEYSCGFQRPVITGTMNDKNGMASTTYQYKDLGAQGTVNMTLGDKLEILRDPKRSLVLTLESAVKTGK